MVIPPATERSESQPTVSFFDVSWFLGILFRCQVCASLVHVVGDARDASCFACARCWHCHFVAKFVLRSRMSWSLETHHALQMFPLCCHVCASLVPIAGGTGCQFAVFWLLARRRSVLEERTVALGSHLPCRDAAP